jgi:hypothetical protein
MTQNKAMVKLQVLIGIDNGITEIHFENNEMFSNPRCKHPDINYKNGLNNYVKFLKAGHGELFLPWH